MAITLNSCSSDSVGCRRLVVLSTDQIAIDEAIDDSDAPVLSPWPFGADRERHDVVDQNEAWIYWRHFDPTGLDMPCLLHVRFDGELYCR